MRPLCRPGRTSEGPDLIYLPEVAFDIEGFPLTRKETAREETVRNCRCFRGDPSGRRSVCLRINRRSGFRRCFRPQALTGTANYLARRLSQEIGCKTRSIELSSLQRAASHLASRIDILEAFQVGGAAVKAADEGDTGEMVILKRISDDPYQCTTEPRNVHKVSNVEKPFPENGLTRTALM